MDARWLLLLVGACGGADIADGTIRCSVAGDCPEGFVCRADRACYRTAAPDAAGDAVGSPDGAAPCPDEGQACAPPACGAWGACGDFGAACAREGTRSRTCRISTCTEGRCQGHDEVDVEPCTRDTDGWTCGATTCGPWDHQDLDCSPGCTDERTCTDFACADGACQARERTDTGTCTSSEICGSHTCACGTFDRICDPGGTCVIAEPCASICG